MAMNKNITTVLSWLFLIIILITAGLISIFDNYNIYFLGVLMINLIIAVIFGYKFDKSVIVISRTLAGLLFIYSGFVKGVDPMGTNYKIIDYFIAYNMDWATPYALYLSVFMNAFEFIIGGVLLLSNICIKYTSWLVLLMMAFFTFTTLGDALYNTVPECGCFGSALIISNWQTFYKNLVIDVFVLIIFLSRHRIKPTFPRTFEWAIFILASIIFVSFETYCIRHLPVIDFSAWKVGNRLAPEHPKPVEYYLIYKNKKSGEEKEYLSPNFPYNDSIWMSEWEFVKQRIYDPNEIKGQDVTIIDSAGNNLTKDFIQNPGCQFILMAYDLSTADKEVFKKINEFYDKCTADGYSFIILTSSLKEEIEKFKKQYNVKAEFYNSDDTALEAAIRSNPGLVLIRNSVVLGKWHYNDFPEYSEVKQKYMK